MAQTRKRRKLWSYATGDKGRNRVRVVERPNGRYYLEWAGNSAPTTATTRVEAADAARDKSLALLAVKRNELTIGALFDMFLKEVAQHNTNYESRKRSFALMRQRWGEHRLVRTLSARDTEQYTRERLSGQIKAPKSKASQVRARVVQEDLEGLRAAINWALRGRNPETGERLLNENPIPDLVLPKERNPRRTRLDEGEYEAMLAKADEIDTTGRLKLALYLAHTTGHRLSSIRQLRWQDIDFAGCTIFWAGEFQKNGLDHRTPYETGGELDFQLQAFRNRYPEWEYVFQTLRGKPRPLERESFYTWWKECRDAAELPKKAGAGWHMFRRELASDLADAPLALVKEIMGSKNPQVLVGVYQEPKMRQLRTLLKRRERIRKESGNTPPSTTTAYQGGSLST